MLLVPGCIKCIREFELREDGVRIYGQLWRKMNAMYWGDSTHFLRGLSPLPTSLPSPPCPAPTLGRTQETG